MTYLNVRSDFPAVGLSVGSSALAAVGADRDVTGPPVVNRAGRPIGDFVDRVGDPVGILAADGSLYPAAELLAEALLGVARTVTAGRPLPAAVAVAYPGHWGSAAVEALYRAVRRLPPWAGDAPRPHLLADYAAALVGLAADLPARGVVAVCDFGAGGTTVTLVDLNDFGVLGTPVRLLEFSGDAIDRALLTHVLYAGGVPPGATGTAAIAPLTRLRAECRAAKERLSTRTATAVSARAAGLGGDIRLTRPELDDVIRGPLAVVPAVVRELLQRNAIAPVRLEAVVSIGGGAAIPSVTTTLSRHLRVPVITPPHPALAAARGAARCARGEESPTTVVPAACHPVLRAVAWSRATDIPELVPLVDETVAPVRAVAKPRLEFTAEPVPRIPAVMPWYRQPVAVAAAVLMVIAGSGGAAALALRSGPDAASVSTAELVEPLPPSE
jgi:actin-like ATPase involved in cell morphogenesis